MNFWLIMRVALRALSKNKMRAGLTVLGIVIGVAAVILLVSVSQSAGLMIQEQFQALGTNMLFIIPGSRSGGGVQRGTGASVSLTAGDAEAIATECTAALAATALIRTHGQLIAGNVNWVANEIMGVHPSYALIRNWGVERGSFLNDRDMRTAAKVCVIGQTVADNLFPNDDPIGQTVRIKNIPFRIVGILERKGSNLAGIDQDNVVYVPHTTVKKRLNGSAFDDVHAILASAVDPGRMNELEAEIKSLLRQRHRLLPDEIDDFIVNNTSEVARALGIVSTVMTLLLGSVASVSLLVGGVGIMNIMLVSVTERTREIGIRLAVGARSRDILRQFLVEATLLSTLGGALGAVIGISTAVGSTYILNTFMSNTHWPVSISPAAIMIAMSFAAAVGMLFGYYPARKASRLDPIESLRYE